MPRLVRHVIPAIAPVLLALTLTAIGPGASIGASDQDVGLAAVDWPPSSGLVVGEVVTGGASASDEFVELHNAGPASVDLAGMEVVYVTSTGGTVTRKAAWASPTLLEPGRHLLLANGAGVHAAIADVVYTGGLSATGGAIAVRPVGGSSFDAVGWGDAASAFVEGTPAPAPAAGSSIERLPGGQAGNGIDTNDNLADWQLNAAPVAQNLAAPATPPLGPSPSPTRAPRRPRTHPRHRLRHRLRPRRLLPRSHRPRRRHRSRPPRRAPRPRRHLLRRRPRHRPSPRPRPRRRHRPHRRALAPRPRQRSLRARHLHPRSPRPRRSLRLRAPRRPTRRSTSSRHVPGRRTRGCASEGS